jgi:hypothetical protein
LVAGSPGFADGVSFAVSFAVSLELGGRTEMPLPVLCALANDAGVASATAKARGKIFMPFPFGRSE